MGGFRRHFPNGHAYLVFVRFLRK